MSDSDNLATLLGFSSSGIHKSRSPSWGKVASVSGNYVDVVIWSDEDGTQQTVKAVRCCNPSIGDVVALENIDGKYRAIGVKGDTSTGSGSSSAVTGVKGNAETSYRTGTVNLTPANIGAATSSHTHTASAITSGTVDSERLPTASTTQAGIVKVGSGLSIDSNGTLSGDAGTDEKVTSKPVNPGGGDFYIVGANNITAENGTLNKTAQLYYDTDEGLTVGSTTNGGGQINLKSDGSAYISFSGTDKGGISATNYTGKAATAGTADNALAVPWSGVTDKPSWIGDSKPELGDDEIATTLTWARNKGLSTTADIEQYLYDELFDKANIASPTFTGTPTAPTAAAGTSTTQIATTAFVQNAVDITIEAIPTSTIEALS